jgi:hypothetical protein
VIGFPANPNDIFTGLYRALYHINMQEDLETNLIQVNKVYEFIGVDSVKGNWIEV